MQMLYGFLAAAVAIMHFAFVVFAMFGGILTLRYPKMLWLHLPALLWGVAVQWADWICPLTPLENYFRLRSGGAGFEGGFVEHWVSKILYPQDLTLELRYVLGLVLILLNAAVYAYVFLMRGKGRFQ